MDPTEALPDDALANILSRLPACDLAASRSVRKAWYAVVDAHQLLLPHFLPHVVHGLFVNYIDYERPRFFARPSKEQPSINGDLGFLPGYKRGISSIVDHCNGLLIYGGSELCVVNPATRRWERLPRLDARHYNTYLVFDPAVSPHYQVFAIPMVPEKATPVRRVPGKKSKDAARKGKKDRTLRERSARQQVTTECSRPCKWKSTPALKDLKEECEDGPAELSPKQTIDKYNSPAIFTPSPIECIGNQEDPEDLEEWPPSSWMLDVFSSSTRQWQKRYFVREGGALETVASVRLDMTYLGPRWRYSAYWQGALYVHCRGAYVVRLLLQDGKYQLVKTPIDIEESKRGKSFLGKSKLGVYFATTVQDEYQLRVWIFIESNGHISWALKHHIDLDPWAAIYLNQPKGIDKTWFVYTDNDKDGANKIFWGENFDWDSDDDNILNIEDDYEDFDSNVSILGFHPYKEIVFLEVSSLRGVAYHLNSSKVQYLGILRPEDYYGARTNGIYESFPYTPLAWLGSFQNGLEIILSLLGFGSGDLGGGEGAKSKETEV